MIFLTQNFSLFFIKYVQWNFLYLWKHKTLSLFAQFKPNFIIFIWLERVKFVIDLKIKERNMNFITLSCDKNVNYVCGLGCVEMDYFCVECYRGLFHKWGHWKFELINPTLPCCGVFRDSRIPSLPSNRVQNHL